MLNAFKQRKDRRAPVEVSKVAYRLLVTAVLLILPLIFIVYLYISQLTQDLAIAARQRAQIETVKQLTLLNGLFAQRLATPVSPTQMTADDQLDVLALAHRVVKELRRHLPPSADISTQLEDCVIQRQKTRMTSLSSQLADNCLNIFYNTYETIAYFSDVMHISSATDRHRAMLVTQQLPLILNQSLQVLQNIRRLSTQRRPGPLRQQQQETEGRLAALITATDKHSGELQAIVRPVLGNMQKMLEKIKRLAFIGVLDGTQETSMNIIHDITELRHQSAELASRLQGKAIIHLNNLDNSLSSQEQSIQTQINTIIIMVICIVILAILLGYFVIGNIREMQFYLKSQNRLLELRVTERTQEIAEANRKTEELNEILVEQNKEAQHLADKAESANRAKSLFLAAMSHEIRTPLNAVIGGSDLLRQTALNNRQRDLLKMVHQSGKTLLELVNDVLDFSKIEAGELTLEQVSFSPKKLVEELINMFQFKAQEKHLTLTHIFDPSCHGEWEGDPTRFKQIIMNLLSNAIKFTDNGSVTCHLDKTEKGILRIRVTDTGIGIQPDKIATLFDAFVQSDNSITRKYGGSGLGLSITKRLIELMGGDITVSSKEEAGTTFEVILPLKQRQQEGAIPLDEPDTQQSEALGTQRLSGHVLLAEDVVINQMIATEVLSGYGLQVSCANNGQEAVDKYQKHTYDLILMDIHMPVMDGLEATSKIREIEKAQAAHSPIPIIAMTADVLAETPARTQRAGLDDYVPKPFEPDELFRVLQKHLNKPPKS
jgi:signal transduction histidine kinase/ActR/RegA family two-component response regulator